MRSLSLGVALILLTVQAPAQQRLDCVRVDGPNGTFSLSCAPEPPTTPPPVNCAGTWGAWTPVEGTAGQWTACQQDVSGQWRQSRQERRTFAVTTPAANGGTACPASPETREFVQSCAPPPPPPTSPPIFPAREVDPEVLGGCSAETHDRTLVDGGDGYRYYTPHPQRDPSGCVYKHEHGHDPAPVIAAMVAHLKANTYGFPAAKVAELVAAVQRPWLFGYAARRMPMPGEPNGHAEPHAGFKFFYALHREQNDEGRFSEMIAGHVAHMGTGGTGRFGQQHHSVESRQFHVPSGSYQITNGMFDFGTADMVCAPRQVPTRDFITIPSRCGIDSPYEIWSGQFEVWQGSTMLARFFSTPAVFDPITVRNAANQSEVVYAWDPRVLATRNHDGDDWSGFRGCNREAYAQPGIYEAAGHRSVWVDIPSGRVTTANAPLAIQQWFYSPIATFDHRGSTPVNGEAKGNQAFKMPRANCGLRAQLGLKN